MAVYQQDMSQIAAPTDRVDEGWYRVRISRVEETTSKESGQPVVKLLHKIQSEGKMLGRTVPDTASLQSQALFKLKAYYEAIGYKPGPEGHDPQRLLDGECYVYVSHGMYQGNPTIDIPPYSIRSVLAGPGTGTPSSKKES